MIFFIFCKPLSYQTARSMEIPVDQLPSPAIIAGLLERAFQALYSATGAYKRVDRSNWESPYTAFFNPEFVPMTATIRKVVENWKSDSEFSRQFLQAINPFQIKIVQHPEDLSEV